MARRPSLDQTARPVIPAPAEPTPAPTAAATKPRSSSRAGKRGVAFWLDPTAFRQLEVVAFEESRTLQSLMEEATDLLFQSRGKHRIARRA